MKNDRVVWGIHAGKTGDAEHLFFQNKVIALGWAKIGDLTKVGIDREKIKKAIAHEYPGKKPGAIPVDAGQLFRFVDEAKKGDLVAYPSKSDRCIHVGQIEGDYIFDNSKDTGYPNQRSVKWLKSVPRTSFTQGALYEIGSAMSFFQIKNYADEFIQAIERSVPKPIDDETDEESAKVVAEEVQESTTDFIIKRLSQELKGHPLSHLVAHLLNTMGYRTRISPPGSDGGIDIIAHRDELGFEPPIIMVQVKSSLDKVGDAAVKSLYGNVDPSVFGLFVTLGSYTPPARLFERSKSNLRLIDGIQLVELILDHYEQIDARYKGFIPLKRVYIPQPIDADETR